jgi:hypothetical protein
MQENTQLVIGENSAEFLLSIRSFNRIFDDLCTTQRETETWTGFDVLKMSCVKLYLFMSFRLNNQIALN